jgi:hypothetical protein
MHQELTVRLIGVVLLALSVGVNVLQAKKIRAMVEPAGGRSSLIGSKARPFEGRTPDGRAIEVAFDARVPTVLYYFSTRCGWCERNWANIEALAASANGRFRVVAVTAQDGINEYVKGRNPRIEFIEAIDDEALRAYRFTATPHTVVIDGSGMVTHEWKGAFMNRIANQVEDLFGVMLPGLAAPAGRPGPE